MVAKLLLVMMKKGAIGVVNVIKEKLRIENIINATLKPSADYRLDDFLIDDKALKTEGEGRNLVYVLNNRTY